MRTATALALAFLLASGMPLGRIACRRDPGPLRARDADTCTCRGDTPLVTEDTH
ncbi:hypothetical protein ACFYWS_20380 [Streptomyces sp. NPDC002795]|uniref:hypothetical protein n=1 Tax=Streptomyces sp. NPDC002795 TaxID=3364665 RepID=UPI003679CCA4